MCRIQVFKIKRKGVKNKKSYKEFETTGHRYVNLIRKNSDMIYLTAW